MKNIDSRSAEVISLKAFNNVLCRELIRARFLSSLDAEQPQLDTMIANMLKDRAVVAYLKNLERIAASSSACVDDYGVAIEREKLLMSSIHAHISSISSSGNGYDSTGSDYMSRRRDLYDSDDIDGLSDGDSSVALMEDQVDEDQEDNTRYSLAQLMKTLDIVTALLESEEMRKHVGKQMTSIQAKKTELDGRIHRKELIMYPLNESVKKMSEWLSAYASEPNPNGHSDRDRNIWSNVKRQMEAATKRLITMKQDVAMLAKERYGFEQKLEQLSSKLKKEINAKSGRVQQLRQSRNQIVTTQPSNPLDIIIRAKEIKVDFVSLLVLSETMPHPRVYSAVLEFGNLWKSQAHLSKTNRKLCRTWMKKHRRLLICHPCLRRASWVLPYRLMMFSTALNKNCRCVQFMFL